MEVRILVYDALAHAVFMHNKNVILSDSDIATYNFKATINSTNTLSCTANEDGSFTLLYPKMLGFANSLRVFGDSDDIDLLEFELESIAKRLEKIKMDVNKLQGMSPTLLEGVVCDFENAVYTYDEQVYRDADVLLRELQRRRDAENSNKEIDFTQTVALALGKAVHFRNEFHEQHLQGYNEHTKTFLSIYYDAMKGDYIVTFQKHASLPVQKGRAADVQSVARLLAGFLKEEGEVREYSCIVI